MKTEQKNKFPIGWAVFAVIVAIAIGLFVNVIGIYNYGNRAEKQIVAEHNNLSNILGQYSLKVSEAAQVPEVYRDDVKEVITSSISARYGADGSKATFQWLKEHNATLDAGVYTKIQQIIEAGRNEYANAQTRFIDIKRGYETQLGYAWSGLWLRVFGYPKIDLDKLKIATSEHAKDALETGVDKGLSLRNK